MECFNQMTEFWTIVETNTAIRIPKYLKNILMLNGYDDALSIQSITTKDIDLFEEFVKNEIDSFIRVNDDPKDFYHIFCDKKDKFQIMKGDRVKLMDVVEFVRKKLASEAGHHSFKQSMKIIQQTTGKTFNSENSKQNYENHRLDVKDNIKKTLKVEVFKEVKGEIEMVTEEFLTTKHEKLHTQTDADLSQTLPTSSTEATENPKTVRVVLSPPSNTQLASLPHVTNRIPAEYTSHNDVNAISVSSIHVGQDPIVDDKSESDMQKDVSSSVSAPLQNISFEKKQKTNSGEDLGDKPYACDVCRRVFGQRGHLKIHQIVHSGQKDYICDVCQKTFGQRSNLETHKMIHSGRKDYVCDVCSKAFRRSFSLNVHQTIHTGQKDYVCDVCQKAFSQRAHLKQHQRIHSGHKPYVCDVCQRAFSQSSNLSTHKRIHIGQKPYVCDVCQKAFSHSGHLNRHQIIHSAKKPYDFCQQTSQPSTLSRHQKIHNDDKEQFSCAHCGKSYNRKFNLKIHLVECFKQHNFEDRFEKH